jgi:hypothetical protein
MVSVHVEAVAHLNRTVHYIKELGARAGVAINPATPVGALEEIAPDVDYILVMSVNPGFGGQAFLPRSESKVRSIRALLDRVGNQAPIEIDGGIDLETVGRVVRAGAEILVAGSAIFHAPISCTPSSLTTTLSRSRSVMYTCMSRPRDNASVAGTVPSAATSDMGAISKFPATFLLAPPLTLSLTLARSASAGSAMCSSRPGSAGHAGVPDGLRSAASITCRPSPRFTTLYCPASRLNSR